MELYCYVTKSLLQNVSSVQCCRACKQSHKILYGGIDLKKKMFFIFATAMDTLFIFIF